MKIKSRLPAMPSHLKRASYALPKKPMTEIDTVAKQYLEEKKVADEANEKVARVKTGIKEMASKVGKLNGKRQTIAGNYYEAGYSLCEPEPQVDLAKLLLLVPPDVLDQVTSRVIDKREFERLVALGDIKKSVLKQVLIPQTPIKKIYVRKLK